jgi:hypothetical protein
MESFRKLGDKRQRWRACPPTSPHVSFFTPTLTRQFQSRRTLSNYLHNIQIADNLQAMYIDNRQVVYVDSLLTVSVGGHLAMFCRRIYHQCFQPSHDRHLREDNLGSDGDRCDAN